MAFIKAATITLVLLSTWTAIVLTHAIDRDNCTLEPTMWHAMRDAAPLFVEAAR